jgi:hypothetical protein
MPKGQDTRHDPARKVGVREINEKFYPPAPQTSTGGGAGGQKPPKKKIAGAGGGGPGGPGGPNDPYGPQKKRDDYNSYPPKPAPNRDKEYSKTVGPSKKEQNPHEIKPSKNPDYNTVPPEQRQLKKKTKDNLNENPAPKKEKPMPPKEERGEKYRNGWYN